jgi:hypothetical protein
MLLLWFVASLFYIVIIITPPSVDWHWVARPTPVVVAAVVVVLTKESMSRSP